MAAAVPSDRYPDGREAGERDLHRGLSDDGCGEGTGATFVANHREGSLAEQFTDAGYGGKIDVILDIAGGDLMQAIWISPPLTAALCVLA